jgi:hypothetical protein
MFSPLVKWYQPTDINKSLHSAKKIRAFLAGSAKNQLYPAKYRQILECP